MTVEFHKPDGSYGGYVSFCDPNNQLALQSTWTSWQLVTGQGQASRSAGYAAARYPCGDPPYDPCYIYSGSQSVTVTPASADLQLSVDTTEVSEGDQVTFTGSIDPAMVGGIAVPYSGVQWSWQPDDGGIVAERVPGESTGPRHLSLNRLSFAPFSADSTGGSGDSTIAIDSIDVEATFEGDLPPDDRPITVACAGSSLVCTMPVYSSGTVTLTAVVNGVSRTKTAHVAVKYYCPPEFEYPDDPITIATAHKRSVPGGVPLGDGPVAIQGPYYMVEMIQDRGIDIPLAFYRPTEGTDFEGRVLWAPPVIAPGYPPSSVAMFQCLNSLKWNAIKGEYELQGRMKYANRVDLYFYRPARAPEGRRVPSHP